jgi:hypothetical protein
VISGVPGLLGLSRDIGEGQTGTFIIQKEEKNCFFETTLLKKIT